MGMMKVKCPLFMPTLEDSIIFLIDKHLNLLRIWRWTITYLDMKGYDYSIENMNGHDYIVEYDENDCWIKTMKG